MSVFYFNKEADNALPCSGAIFLHHNNAFKSLSDLGAYLVLENWDKQDHIFFELDFSKIIDANEVLLSNFNLIISSKKGTKFRIYEVDPFDLSSLTEDDLLNELNKNSDPIFKITTTNNDYETEFFENDITKYVKESINNGNKKVYIRIEHDSIHNVAIAHPNDYESLVTVETDMPENCMTIHELDDSNKIIVNDAKGTIIQVLPSVEGIGLTLNNSQYTDKSNVMTSLKIRIKEDSIYRYTIYDNFGNKGIYRYMSGDFGADYYGLEILRDKVYVFLNISDLSFFEEFDSSLEIFYQDGTVITMSADGSSQDFEGNSIYNLQNITNKDGSYLQLDWSSSNQVIARNHHNETITISISDNKIDSLEIPKWKKKIELEYIFFNNRYYLKEYNEFNCDNFNNYLVKSRLFEYNANMYLTKFNTSDSTLEATYIYESNKLKKILFDNGILNSLEYTYHANDNYTEIKNQFNEVSNIYYNDASQKVMISNNDNYVTYESQSNYKGEYIRQFKEVVSIKDNVLLNSNYQTQSNDSLLSINYWDGFRNESGMGDTVESNSFFPEIIGSNIVKFLGEENNIRTFKTTYESDENYEGDQWFFSIWCKADIPLKEIFQVEFRVNKISNGFDKYTFNLNKSEKNWQILTGSFTTKTNYSSIVYSIKYEGSSHVYIGKAKLYRKPESVHYDYNKLSQVEGFSVGSNQLEFMYDEGKLIRATTQSGRMINYIYDTSGNLILIEDSCSLFKIENEYLNGNIVKQIRTTLDGKTSKTFYEYNEKNELIKSIDEFGLSVDYIYDKFGRLVDLQDSSGIVYSTDYDTKGRIIETKNHINDRVDGGFFEYGNNKELSVLTTKNNTEYEFSYNDMNLINNISVNGSDLESRVYEKVINNYNTGLMTQKQYGNGVNNKFQFEYDDKHRLLTKKNNQNDMVTISYDDENNTVNILDHVNQVLKEQRLDIRGRTVKESITSSNQTIEEHLYTYDNLDGLQKRSYISNKPDYVDRTYDFDHDYEFQEYSLEGYLDRISSAYLNDYLRPNNAGNTLYSKIKIKPNNTSYIFKDAPKLKLFTNDFNKDLNQNVMRFNDLEGCLVFDKNKINSNRVDGKYYGNHQFIKSEWDNDFKDDKIIYAWIKLTGQVTSAKELMRLGSVSLNVNYENEIYLNDNGSIIETNQPIFFDEWTLIGLRVKNIDYQNYSATVYINGKYTIHNVSQNVSEINLLSIGSYPISNPNQTYLNNKTFIQAECVMDVLYVGYGASNTTSDNLTKIYEDGKLYLDTALKYNKDQVSYYNHTIYADAEVVTLNGSYVSSLGKEPKSYSYTDGNYKSNKTKLFKFDHQLQKHIYGSYSNYESYDAIKNTVLSYDFIFSTVGSVNIFVKPFSKYKSEKRTILGFMNGTVSTLDLFIDENYILKYKINGAEYNSRMQLDIDKWNMVTMLWQPNQVQLSLNNSEFKTKTTFTIDLTGTTLFIGSRYLDDIPINHFEGQLQMLSIWDTNITKQKITKLFNEGLQLSVQTEYDNHGRMKATNIINNKSILTKKYQYFDEKYIDNNEEKQKFNALPTSEIDIDGNEIVYIYDEYLNVTTKEIIDDSGKPISVTRYKYDDLKRLAKETLSSVSIDETDPANLIRNETFDYSYKYKYDSNGNILEKTSVDGSDQVLFKDTYHYSTTYKDRLERISRLQNSVETDIYNFAYSSDNQFRPITITKDGQSKTLSWNGPRLMQYGTTQYAYNESGLRIKKTGTNINVKYDLDGSMVIKSTDTISSKSIDYHFDQNEQVIGFRLDGKEFLYQRNILGEIYGIINTSGKLFVKYDYTAFGVPTITLGSGLNSSENSIAQILVEQNIYMYKGYVYDSDTELYYCQTRFYNPEIGRWISIDDISYLDSSSIDGLNLYAYCVNSPIMYSDSSGTSVIFFAVLCAIALGGLTVTTLGVMADNSTVTAIGLAMVAVPAIISGSFALVSALSTGATLTGVIGGITFTAGVGTTTFMTAEIQEASGKGNWIMETTGMEHGIYNRWLMGTAVIATAGTFASSVSYGLNIKSIQGFEKNGDFYGLRYKEGSGKPRILEFHNSTHKGTHEAWHWQLKKYGTKTGYEGPGSTLWRRHWWKLRILKF